jgi:hypothetical protein
MHVLLWSGAQKIKHSNPLQGMTGQHCTWLDLFQVRGTPHNVPLHFNNLGWLLHQSAARSNVKRHAKAQQHCCITHAVWTKRECTSTYAAPYVLCQAVSSTSAAVLRHI